MENKTPKIALCLSGLIRHSFFCFPYIYQNFLNQDLDVDVFIHTWNESSVIDLYKPKNYKIENRDDVLKLNLSQLDLKNISVQGNINNNISMFYSIKECFDLVPSDYDIIIRCRFDLILQEKIDFVGIMNDILQNKYNIFIPNKDFNCGGYTDQLAIGSYNSMKTYSDCILHLGSLSKELGKWHPESLLGLHLTKNNLLIHQDDYDYRIVRDVVGRFHFPEKQFIYRNI